MKKIKQIKSELLKKSNTGYRFIINTLEKIITEDNWEEGEIGTTQYQFIKSDLGRVKSVEEIIETCSIYGTSTDINYWRIIDGRLTCNILEDDDSNEVTKENSSIFQKYKSGEINLWSCNYDVYVELITPDNMLIENPTSQQLHEATGIQLY